MLFRSAGVAKGEGQSGDSCEQLERERRSESCDINFNRVRNTWDVHTVLGPLPRCIINYAGPRAHPYRNVRTQDAVGPRARPEVYYAGPRVRPYGSSCGHDLIGSWALPGMMLGPWIQLPGGSQAKNGSQASY